MEMVIIDAAVFGNYKNNNDPAKLTSTYGSREDTGRAYRCRGA